MRIKNNIIIIDNIPYISQHITLEKYNEPFSTCTCCDCHVSGLNVGYCLAIDRMGIVPCDPFICFKKLPRGL